MALRIETADRRPYPRYRDSGVEWLGDVPDHWEVRRLEHVARYRTSNVDKKTEDDELPVRLCNYTDVYYGDRIRVSEAEFMEATASPNEVARFGLRVGDVLITKDSEDWEDIAVPALVDETADDFVCGYHLGIIRSGPAMDAGFLYRAMQSGAVNRQLQTSASGVTRYGLPNAAVGDALLPLPPLDEQRAIAAYLDRETERIDALVAKKRLLIERLEEYRTALITRTVTRGLPPEAASAADLDPSPCLKPSGVEWLGEVPEHWGVRPLKTVLDRNDSGVWGDDPDDDEGTVVLRSTEQTVDGGWSIDDPAHRALGAREEEGCAPRVGRPRCDKVQRFGVSHRQDEPRHSLRGESRRVLLQLHAAPPLSSRVRTQVGLVPPQFTCRSSAAGVQIEHDHRACEPERDHPWRSGSACSATR